MKVLFYCLSLLAILSCGKEEDAPPPRLNLQATLVNSRELPFMESDVYDLFIRNEQVIGITSEGSSNYDWVNSPSVFQVTDLESLQINTTTDQSMRFGSFRNFLLNNNKALFCSYYEEFFVLDFNSSDPASNISLSNLMVEYMVFTNGLSVVVLNQEQTGHLSVCTLSENGQSLDTLYTQAALSTYLPKLKVAKAFTHNGEQYLTLLIDNGYFNQNVRKKSMVVLNAADGSVVSSNNFALNEDRFIQEQEGIAWGDQLVYFAGPDIYSTNMFTGETKKYEVGLTPVIYHLEAMVAVDANTIVFRNATEMAALNLATGNVIWRKPLPGKYFFKVPVPYNNFILVSIQESGFDQHIGVMDINSGEYLGNIISNNGNQDLSFNSRPLVLNDQLYIGSDDELFQYDLSPVQ